MPTYSSGECFGLVSSAPSNQTHVEEYIIKILQHFCLGGGVVILLHFHADTITDNPILKGVSKAHNK